MSLIFNQKEDLRMRMADLQHRLAESEEERKKLEKTCNILMRAFREEEKMHYKALSNKYEKFLEDCKLRRRRNDIILRSLCRVEDRARALFARTERLKVLKDRYITYIRPNNLQNTETSSLTWKTPTSKVADEVISKSVHWKTPQVADVVLNPKTRDVSETGETKALRNGRLDKDLPQNFETDYPSRYKTFTEKYYQHSPTIENHLDSPEIVKEDRQSILNKILHKKELPRPHTQEKSNSIEIGLLNSEPSKKSPAHLSRQFSTYKEESNNYENPNKSPDHFMSRPFSTYKEESDNYENSKKSPAHLSRQFSTYKEESNNYENPNKSPAHFMSKPFSTYNEESDNYESSKKSPTNLTSRQFSTYKELNKYPGYGIRHNGDYSKEKPDRTDILKEGLNNFPAYGINHNGDYSMKKLDKTDVLENNLSSDSEMEFKDLKKVTALRERGVAKHQESIEKLKTALSLEDDVEEERKDNEKPFEISPDRSDEESNQKIIEKDEIETNEKSEGKNELKVSKFPKTDNENTNHLHLITSSPKINLTFTERDDLGHKETGLIESKKEIGVAENETDQKSGFSPPMSLDGVDYENETYPESYYEQPVHQHNYSNNIASNVILEEDENEQEADQPEVSDGGVKNLFIQQKQTYSKTLSQEQMLDNQSSLSSSQSPGRSVVYDEPYADEKSQESGSGKGFDKQNIDHGLNENQQQIDDQFKGRDSGSEKSVEVEKHGINTRGSSPSESKGDGSIKKLKNITQSNLAHLLESDSESFQIEHGDLNSGNEDSDFDFSFHQN